MLELGTGEPEHVFRRMLPKTPPNVVIEVAIGELSAPAADPELNRKFGVCPWRESPPFNGVPAESFVLLEDAGHVRTLRPLRNPATPIYSITDQSLRRGTCTGDLAAGIGGDAVSSRCGRAEEARGPRPTSESSDGSWWEETEGGRRYVHG